MKTKISASAIIIMVIMSACALVIATAVPAQAGKTLTVSPVKLEVKATPGQAETHTVKVINHGTEKLHVTSELADYLIKPDNSFVFFAPGTKPYSSAGWVSLDEREFDLSPGDVKKVGIKISVPKSAEVGGHYGAVFFRTRGSNPLETGVSVVGQIGVLTLVSVGNEKEIVRQGTIRAFKIDNGWLGSNANAQLTFRNTGNVHLTLKGDVTFVDLFGRRAGQVPLQSLTILPKSDRVMTAEWKGPFFGRFTTVGRVRYGADLFTFDHIEKSHRVTFWIIPWRIILAVTIIAGTLLSLKRVGAGRSHRNPGPESIATTDLNQ